MNRRILIIVATVALGSASLAAPATAKPEVEQEYDVTGVGTNNQITRGPDGNMWVTLDAGGDYARITRSGAVTEFDAPTVSNPIGITSAAGLMWVTQNGGVARFDASGDPENATATPIADIADPRAITKGPGSAVWTASGDKVIKIPTANPAGFTSFATTGVTGARWIAGSGGLLWVADFGGAQVVRVNGTGVGQPFPTGGGPQGIATGPGKQIAYSNPGTSPQTIGRIRPGGNPMTTNTPNADPFGVTFGSDGAYWVAQFAANNLARLTPDGKRTNLAGFSAAAGPRQIAKGPRKTLWVTLDTANRVAEVTGVRLNTRITDQPPKRVATDKRRAKVTLRFRGSPKPTTFECSLKRKGGKAEPFKQCDSPERLRLKAGAYRFSVRASSGGVADTSPAVASFRIVRS